MRLTAQARIYLPGEDVFRKPTFWDNVKGMFGSDVDLRTGETRVTRDVLALTEQIQQGLALAGITNAVSLVVDTDVIYQDIDGVPNDAGLLVAAMRRASSRFSQGFNVLRAVFELEAQGLHSLIEVTVRAVHKKTEPSATVAVGSRILELRPADGEDIEAAKDRIGKALGNAQLVPTYRGILTSQTQTLQAALQRVFANGQVELDPVDAQVVRPSGADVRALGQDSTSRHPDLRDVPVYPRAGYYGAGYDPWGTYYRDPMDTFVNLMIIDAMLSPRSYWGYGPGFLGSHWSSYGAPVNIINYNGSPICSADQIGDHAAQFSAAAQIADSDFSTAQWDDRALAGYDAQDSNWSQYSSGSASNDAANTFDCAGYDDKPGTGSFDCAGAADCAASDCSWDCSSDCSWDCSSDCSSDCGGDW